MAGSFEQSPSSSSSPPAKMVAANLTAVFNTLITGLHILHYNGVLDAYGHMSVRNPNNGSNFFMSRNLAPALVANSSDLVEYHVEDAAPVDPNAPSGFIERYIHSELYKRFPSINSVVHSHSPQVVPYTFSGVPLRPTLHMAGFLGMYRNPFKCALLIFHD
jgi:ribulose-5-phosphate 4-epimerase/fuculose-1-phosphate aldolase